ncbi:MULTISPECIES: nuclear transport factor 2 family protein [unclassified Coleofasciculus]|uniref:nuclear transport factor 2 family protein n=1 Tax=unclassified Coleofasciculus TaxID=2692782 RepID=UPI0018824A2B|nr:MULTISPECIES: nuclear transport factor 2 family protein [unclassified Coleofasciculus]MBE9129528.1 nuclear transport factor 2 family protein [Coleofasciculus sp. LEGE 07081]MBE9152107.1 nuclear transport factor 2 family protein [Coleofasciculus sp. LEGE 07092]
MTTVNYLTQTQGLTIDGITLPLVLRYFETMNAGNYEATAALFADSGAMHPPFEQPIEGTDAIASYLNAEATGMQLLPRQGVAEILDNGDTEVQVTGRVETPFFGVNVAWIFVLNPNQDITFARIKLLASPQELLNLRR